MNAPAHVALIYWDPFTPGGVQSQIAGRIETLGQRDGPVRYTLFSAARPKSNPWPQVRLVEFRGWQRLSIALYELTASFSLSRALARVHKQDPIDLIDFHAIGASPFVMRWARKSGVPVVATCHSLRFFSIPNHGHRWEVALYYRWTNCQAFRAAKRVVAVSAAIKNELVSFGVPPDRISVVNPAVSAANGAARKGECVSGTLKIAFVGRTSREKGLDVLVEALRLANQSLPTRHVHLKIVGSVAADSPLRKLVDRENLPVEFLEHLENREARAVMAGADVVVVPSLYEPFGLVCVEALLAGALVIASNVGGLSEIIEDSRTGVLVPPGDSKAVEHVLVDIIEHPDRFVEIRARAREAGLRHTWKARGPELLELYRRLISADVGTGEHPASGR